MKITGYALREALKQQELMKSAAEGEFKDTLSYEEGTDPVQPQTVVAAFEAAELAISKLETAQALYNLTVSVAFEGQNISLLSAIKLVGFLGRIEKMWKGAITNPVSEHPYYDDKRKPRKRTVSSQDAIALTKAYGKKCNALRAAIAVANGVEIDIPDLDPALFE